VAVPNWQRAVIDPAKLRDYLLSPVHPVGRFKAAYFSRLGYSQERWVDLEESIRRHLRESEDVRMKDTSYGPMFEVRGSSMRLRAE
jgi:hypothetical protein